MVTRIMRYAQIVDVLSKYGFGIGLEKLFPGRARFRLPTAGKTPETSTIYERIRLTLEELGPTFVKFGQIMSTRTELLPPEMIEQLKKLQDHAKPVPFSEIRAVIEQSCVSIDDWFAEFEETPVASASIGQVHRAVLKDGTRVAVKVQRPGIEEIIETDIGILQSMAERIETVFPETRVYNPVGMVEDFSHQIVKELDFARDGRNADRMARNFRDVPGIRFPKIYWEYSSSRVLVMEFIEGVRIDDPESIMAMGHKPHEIGVRGFHVYLKMIFEDGFFHGDPHPGNLLVTAAGDIVFLDFGIVGVLRPEKRQNFINLLFALVNDDIELMLRSLEGFGIVIAEADREGLRDDLYLMMHDFSGGGGEGVSQLELPAGGQRTHRDDAAVPAQGADEPDAPPQGLHDGAGHRCPPRPEVQLRHRGHPVPFQACRCQYPLRGLRQAGVHVPPRGSGRHPGPAPQCQPDAPAALDRDLQARDRGHRPPETADGTGQGKRQDHDRPCRCFAGSRLIAGPPVITVRAAQRDILYRDRRYTAAVLVGFYAIYHVIFLRFRMER